MIEIETPDGTIVEFPEGTDESVILDVMRREYGGPEPTGGEPSQPKPKPVPPNVLPSGDGGGEAPSDESGWLERAAHYALSPGALTGRALEETGIADAARTLADPEQRGEAISRQMKPRQMQETLRGAGAAGGGMLGAPGGIPGILAGTAAGSAVGHAAGDLYGDIHGTVTGEEQDTPSPLERLTGPAESAAWDTALTGGVAAAPQAARGARDVMARALGGPTLSPAQQGATREAAKEASDLGVDLGVANVAERGLGHVFPRTFAQIPFVGGGIRREATKQAEQGVGAAERFGRRIGVSRDEPSIGEDMFREGERRFDRFAEQAQQRYTQARETGEQAGSVIESAPIRDAASKALREMTQRPEGVKAVVPDEIVDRLQRISKMPDRISTPELRGIDHDIENMMRAARTREGISFGELNQVRSAGTRALERAAENEPAARALRDADQFFERGKTVFDTPTGQRFGRVQRNVFDVGIERPGSREADELMRVAVNARSPAAIRDLRNLVGDEGVRSVARRRYNDALDRAFGDGDQFDSQKFRTALGLGRKDSGEYEAFQEMLKGTDVSVPDLEKFSRVMENVTSVEIAEASKMMQRATGLRGATGVGSMLKGLLTAGTGGAITYGATQYGGGAGAGVASLIGTVALARYGGGALMRPRLLKSMTRAMDTDASTTARNAAALHLATAMEADDDQPRQSPRPASPSAEQSRGESMSPLLRGN